MSTAVLHEDATEKVGEGLSSDRKIASTMSIQQAQVRWASTPLKSRIRIFKAGRHELVRVASDLAAAISQELHRTPADTLVAEVLPLLAACCFLERNAESILAPRRLGRRGLPFWLAGVDSEIHHVPLGRVLVIGPANYPLFLPGAQVLQALAAGNAVTWKPGRGGFAVAEIFEQALFRAGLPPNLLCVTAESVKAGQLAMQEVPDKVFFTGSAATGRMLMRQMAETLTPCVMELSGCDAVIVLPSADLPRAVQALVFGMRLNGSATCMAPRRVLLVDASPECREAFVFQLQQALAAMDQVAVPESVRQQMRGLLEDARQQGARVLGDAEASLMRPILVTDATTGMQLAKADVFAPVLSVIGVKGEAGVLAAQEDCPFSLTAAIFGEETEARCLAAKLVAGSVLINDIIVPTADPRVPFGGRRQSGFGVTRGVEGLLEMTAVKTIAVRRGQNTRHYEATTAAHEGLFGGLISATHASGWTERWRGMKQLMKAARQVTPKT